MLDQTPAPLLTLGDDGFLRVANRSARRLFGADDQIACPATALTDAIERTGPGRRTTLKLPGREAGASLRSYTLSVASSVAAGQRTRLVVLTDIEAEMQAAQAQAAHELLQVLGHEIMNALTPITSLAESAHALAMEALPDSLSQVQEALETILRCAGGLERFVQGYRRLARLPPPDLRPGSLKALLRHVGHLFQSRWPEIPLMLRLPAPDIMVWYDADQLAHALLNLLANAAEAASCGAVRPAWVMLSAVAHGNGAAFRVSDSGDGVTLGQEQAIFRPFFGSRPEGTGIGLSLAKQIAHLHGGTLLLEPSALNRGASFLMTVDRRGKGIPAGG